MTQVRIPVFLFFFLNNLLWAYTERALSNCFRRLVMERGIKVQWNGDPSLLTTECKNNLAKLVLMTKDNDNFIFEAGLAYSGTFYKLSNS